jgi:hypothetical protein
MLPNNFQPARDWFTSANFIAIFWCVVICWSSKVMKPSFVRIYLLVAGVILAVAALAKWPAIFHARTWCADADILSYQPGLTNEQLLGMAAGTELLIVLLICFSPRRWLPCIASAVWGLLCFLARLFLMDPYANCRCLGWLAKPGPTTNLMVGFLALALAGGGWVAFRLAWRDEKLAKQNQNSPQI